MKPVPEQIWKFYRSGYSDAEFEPLFTGALEKSEIEFALDLLLIKVLSDTGLVKRKNREEN